MKTPLEISNVRNITFRAVNKHDVSLRLEPIPNVEQAVCSDVNYLSVLKMSDVSDIFITDIAIKVTRDCYAGIVLENCNGAEIKGSKSNQQ